MSQQWVQTATQRNTRAPAKVTRRRAGGSGRIQGASPAAPNLAFRMAFAAAVFVRRPGVYRWQLHRDFGASSRNADRRARRGRGDALYTREEPQGTAIGSCLKAAIKAD